ncbi:MAG: class I SAM-dependent methyltransferase [Myxococcaceae bacterium]
MADTSQQQAEPQPPDTAAPFSTESVLARLGRRLELEETSRVLEFRVRGPSLAVLLARDLGCRITVADPSPAVLEQVQLEADAAGVLSRLTLLALAGEAPSLPEAAFELAISGERARALAPLAGLLRPALVPSHGRLVAVVAARVGLGTRDLGAWERAFGQPLRSPQAELAELLRSGFEPEWAEALSEPQLVQLYGAQPGPPEEEAALVQLGPAGLSFVLVAARRREPGEAPPPARDRG